MTHNVVGHTLDTSFIGFNLLTSHHTWSSHERTSSRVLSSSTSVSRALFFVQSWEIPSTTSNKIKHVGSRLHEIIVLWVNVVCVIHFMYVLCIDGFVGHKGDIARIKGPTRIQCKGKLDMDPYDKVGALKNLGPLPIDPSQAILVFKDSLSA